MCVPELQKLCCNCQHFEFDYGGKRDPIAEYQPLTFRCDQDRYDVKGRAIAHGQFLMYMYMGQQCEHFQVLDFRGPKGRAGLPSGEQFGGGGLLQVDPPPKSDDIPQR